MRFSVITALACPCEDCCGDYIAKPEVEDYATLSDAIAAFGEDYPDVEEGTETSSCPLNLESAAHAWITQYGHNYGGGCDNKDTAWQKSLHINGNVTPSSRLRILRLLMKNR